MAATHKKYRSGILHMSVVGPQTAKLEITGNYGGLAAATPAVVRGGVRFMFAYLKKIQLDPDRCSDR
jgi:hypothetical protein